MPTPQPGRCSSLRSPRPLARLPLERGPSRRRWDSSDIPPDVSQPIRRLPSISSERIRPWFFFGFRQAPTSLVIKASERRSADPTHKIAMPSAEDRLCRYRRLRVVNAKRRRGVRPTERPARVARLFRMGFGFQRGREHPLSVADPLHDAGLRPRGPDEWCDDPRTRLHRRRSCACCSVASRLAACPCSAEGGSTHRAFVGQRDPVPRHRRAGWPSPQAGDERVRSCSRGRFGSGCHSALRPPLDAPLPRAFSDQSASYPAAEK